MNKLEAIIIHCSGGIESDPTYDTSTQTPQIIDDWHKQLGFPKSERSWHIGYHWIITYRGELIQCRNEWEIGAHCLGMNDKSLSICLMGNFDRLPALSNSKPSEAQITTLRQLLRQLRQKYPNVPIRPHRYYASNRTCFGRNLPNSWGEDLIKEPEIATLEKQKLDIMSKIIAILKLLIIRWQNHLGGSKYM